MKFCLPGLILTVLFQVSVYQLKAQQATDDIILKAMSDELNRNMAELKLSDFEKPFFMMYGILDSKTYSIASTLGSVTRSDEDFFRGKTNTRVLVGDYSFNDESLEDNLFSAPSGNELNLPLENDYWGIRRAFWSSTDKVYRDAARHFERHKETLKENGKGLPELPHRSFAKSSPVHLVLNAPSFRFDRTQWETAAKKLSALFLNHPSIDNSTVIIEYTEGHKYLVNSEGTFVKTPINFTKLVVLGQCKSSEGEFSLKQVVHVSKLPSQLPSEEQLRSEVERMISTLEAEASKPKLMEEYTGPTLLIGPIVAELFSSILFKGNENIFANDNIIPLEGLQYDNNEASLSGKIGRNICSELVTIKAKPKLKSFNGIELLSSFEIDDEGIVPADEVNVVESGILKNLLNNRTITNSSQTANGFSSGPGVIEVMIKLSDSEKLLKEKLIAQARKDGLDYAMIIREASGFGIVNVYKVSVADGKEELVRNASLNRNNLKTVKRILGASESYNAHNLVEGNNGRAGGIALVSMIVPQAVLIQEMEIQPFRLPSLKEEKYVSSPLK